MPRHFTPIRFIPVDLRRDGTLYPQRGQALPAQASVRFPPDEFRWDRRAEDENPELEITLPTVAGEWLVNQEQKYFLLECRSLGEADGWLVLVARVALDTWKDRAEVRLVPVLDTKVEIPGHVVTGIGLADGVYSIRPARV